MRIRSVGHAFFAATLLGLGVLGLVQGDFGAMWQPVPKEFLLRTLLAYACALVLLLSGAGVFWTRASSVAARLIFAWFAAWLLLVRVPYMFVTFQVNTWWAAGQMSVMTAAAWVLFVWFGSDGIASRLAFLTGDRGLRLGRALFGVGLIPFGIAHFMYMDATAPLIPAWIPWHVPLAYATGAAFIAGGLANITGVWGRLAAILSAWQIGGFTAFVWVPVIAKGNANAGQWREFITSVTLTAGAWMVADGYRAVRGKATL